MPARRRKRLSDDHGTRRYDSANCSGTDARLHRSGSLACIRKAILSLGSVIDPRRELCVCNSHALEKHRSSRSASSRVEGIEKHVLIVPTLPEPIKVRHPALVAGNRLAMPNANAGSLAYFAFAVTLISQQ